MQAGGANAVKRLPLISILALVLFSAHVLAQEKSQCVQIVFGGELNAGEKFTREIGNGLTFRIDPWKESMGWEFEIGPASPNPGEWDQYVYVLTPPYRSSSAREVNTGWGVTAQDAVKGARQFWFLVSRADAPAASAAINDVLWPKSDKQQEAALEKLAALRKGTGVFKIEGSKITPGIPVPGFADCERGHCGEIHWIKFQVRLIVPRSFTPAKDLQLTSVQCPHSSGLPVRSTR